MENTAPSLDLPPSFDPGASEQAEAAGNHVKITIALVAAVVLVVASIFYFGNYLIQPETDTTKWRDAFIVALSVELFILGVVAVVLVFQLARLVNLIQNEVRPVLEAANETMNTVRGTADFLSSNLVNPVVKVNSYMAAAKRLLSMVNIKL